jgi:hypothetical protein
MRYSRSARVREHRNFPTNCGPENAWSWALSIAIISVIIRGGAIILELSYNPSSIRTGYRRQSEPTKLSMTLICPPQHGHDGSNLQPRLFGLLLSLSSESVPAAGAASKLRQSATFRTR